MTDGREEMDAKKFIYRETALIAVGEFILVGLMLAVFAILGEFDGSVLIGGLAGGILTVANFFVMALNASAASDKALNQNINAGKSLMHMSYIVRYAVIFIILAVLAKTGAAHPVSCVLPLVFIQPVIIIKEFLKKKVG